MKLFLSQILILFLTWHCVSSPTSQVREGVNTGYQGFVPARIVVFDCVLWPDAARYRDLPLMKDREQVEKASCPKINEFILAGFKDQPFMKGFSPKAVQKMLELNQKTELLTQWQDHWKHNPGDCFDCKTPEIFYHQSIQNRTSWKMWLNTLSQNTKFSDAILFPLLTYQDEDKTNDRGVWKARRRVLLSLMLIDTNNGDLIWTKSGYAEIKNESQENFETQAPEKLNFPDWEKVFEKLFMQDLWQDFPGRIIAS